jgi:hypothetical protein
MVTLTVDKDMLNGVVKTTDVHAGREPAAFIGEFVFGADAFPVFAFQSPIARQDIDAAYGRAINAGRGVVGEGGDQGPGVVGIAGGVIPRQEVQIPRDLQGGPQLGRGFRAGVVGFGAGEARREGGDAVGVLGVAATSLGVWGSSLGMPGVLGSSNAHAGVYGFSATRGVTGDASTGQIGVEGFGNVYGVYGHVNFVRPNPNGAGVFGAAAPDPDVPEKFTGRAGVFVGPVDVNGKLTCSRDLVVFGTKAAAARHTDGTHRLLYCIESAQSQFEDFGEAKLVKGRARVRIDRDFAALADVRTYHVFLTACGESNGLYVAERNQKSFEVREQGGGRSSIAFSYRIVARRKHVTEVRFQKVSLPKVPKIPAQLPSPPADLHGVFAGGKKPRAAGRKTR